MTDKKALIPSNQDKDVIPSDTSSAPDVLAIPRSRLKSDRPKLRKELASQLAVFPPPAPLSPRITTCSERNLIRLRISLSSYARSVFTSRDPSRRNPCLLRFGPSTVIKFSGVSRAAEAANIEYIARNTNIPVPRVHDVFVIEDMTYIIMDYINAPELTRVWDQHSTDQKASIFEQLKTYISQLRNLKPPHPGRLESADGSGLFDARLCMGGQPMGPFNSIAEFHTHLGHDSILMGEQHRDVWPYFKTVAQRQYRTTFTHCDIAPRNILVKDGKIVAIVDWESAGWYPEYWEYTRWEVSNYISGKMWKDIRDDIMDTYPDERKVEAYLDTVFTRL